MQQLSKEKLETYFHDEDGEDEWRFRNAVRNVSQDTYWCHTVSVFTAFSPNRIGECDSYYRIYCSTNWCSVHVGSGQ